MTERPSIIKKTSERDLEPQLQKDPIPQISKEDSFFNNGETTRDPKPFVSEDFQIPNFVHKVQNETPLDETVEFNAKAILNATIARSKRKYSKEYIPLGSITDNAYLKLHEIKDLHFQQIFLNSTEQSSLNKVVFKHNEQTKEIRFYIPTFLRFSLVKLHSEDLKNITHIENKNNMIIYINVYTRGLPKMLIDRLTKRSKTKDGEEEAKLLFRANRHLFEAKYYTSYHDYLIFMFNPFSDKMIEFEIMKNVMFAPFEEAELILHIKINKKVFKLERSKTLKIAKSSHLVESSEAGTPLKKPKKKQRQSKTVSFHSIQESIEQIDIESSEQEEFDILHFSKIVMEFKVEKPKNITDSFRFHKSIEFGNYGIMTNEINIHVGSYESPQKKKQMEAEKASLGGQIDPQEEEELHENQLEDISTLRLSIGLYKHPVTQLCTFFIPLMLAGGLTLLLFHLCDHSLTNELEVLAIILVAYGAFIPQFRQRISMSRTVIIVDFYIVYNMIPAILCAFQSINESRHKKTYNIYQVISMLIYYTSILFLAQIYLLYLYVDKVCFKKHTEEMVHNFDTDIFLTQTFQDDPEKSLSWFLLKGQKQRAYFCQRQDPVEKPKKIKFQRKETRVSYKFPDDPPQMTYKTPQPDQLAESIALEIRMSSTTNKTLHEAKETLQDEIQQKHEQHEYLYKTKAIENQRHVHSFEKIINIWRLLLGLLIILTILSVTILLSWAKIYEILNFEDLNKNCIHDEEEATRLARVESIIQKEQTLSELISQVIFYLLQSWNDASIPVPLDYPEEGSGRFFYPKKGNSENVGGREFHGKKLALRHHSDLN